MKRIVVLLSIVLLMTGCSVKTLSNVDIGKNIKTLLSEKSSIHNVYFEGYKYYVPKGMQFLNKEDYNATFVDAKGYKYYLYVDAISYYHKVENTYQENDTSHFSRKINYNKKTGYIQIDKQDDGYYLINYMYNYAKMECLVSERDLVTSVDNMSYILRSIKFNDKILESLIGDNILSYQEENFSLFEDTTSKKDDFLDVYQEIDNPKFKDEDQIDIDND